MQVSLKRKGDRPLQIVIPAGTYFTSGGSVQNMVSTARAVADLSEQDETEITLSAACANFHRPEPGESDRFSIRAAPRNSRLRRLLEVIGQRGASEPAAQIAVWAVTDNPSRGELDATYQSSI